MAPKRLHYDAALKRKVIAFAEGHGNRVAGRTFGISEVNVRRWRNDRDSIFSCKSTAKCFSGPKEGRYSEVDRAVLAFVIEGRARGLAITRETIQSKARCVSEKLGIDESEFKARRGWYDRFMRREGLSLSRRRAPFQLGPVDFERRLLNFQQCMVISKKNQRCYEPIGDADDTSVFVSDSEFEEDSETDEET